MNSMTHYLSIPHGFKVIWEFLTNNDIGPYARVYRDPDHFGKRRKENPYFDIPSPAVEPGKNTEWVGFRDKGAEEDWKQPSLPH